MKWIIEGERGSIRADIEEITTPLEPIPHKDIFTQIVDERTIAVYSRDILLFTIKLKDRNAPSQS